MKTTLLLGGAMLAGLAVPAPAHAFGDEGHQVVALVARTQLTPRALAAADRLLATDTTPFRMRDGKSTSDSWARQATWADYYRASQSVVDGLPSQIHSYSWHFADIQLQGGSLNTACFDFPRLAAGTPASQGPDPDCVVNKIEQFSAELAADSTPDAEKLLALKFLMHFVGDIHQPLHATDNLDRGGNNEIAVVGSRTAPLHSHWDTTFVELIGAQGDTPNRDAQSVADGLRKPSPIEAAQWLGAPAPRVWALESYALGQSYVYAPLPAPSLVNTVMTYQLDAKYTRNAVRVTQEQLLRAGYRLAAVINSALSR